MTELAYVLATAGAFLVLGGLWARYGKYAAGAWLAALASVAVVVELVKFLFRGPGDIPDKMPREGTHVPDPGIEAQRRELAKVLKAGEQRLVEARKDGTAALKAELDRNRREP